MEGSVLDLWTASARNLGEPHPSGGGAVYVYGFAGPGGGSGGPGGGSTASSTTASCPCKEGLGRFGKVWASRLQWRRLPKGLRMGVAQLPLID